jgi:hypothetical protein
LAKNGILWRPQPDEDPRFVAAWKKIFSRELVTKPRDVPKLETIHGKTHALKKPLKKVDDKNFNGAAWSGAGIRGGGPWGAIIGTWKVPTVRKPSEPQGEDGGWDSSSWVGIDGFNVDITSNDVLQAGVQQTVDVDGKAGYVAWFEWFAPTQSDSPSYINQTNFIGLDVHAGNEITCFIALFHLPLVPPIGVILFQNETTHVATMVLLVAPPGATASGNTIEWIMEAPNGGEPITALPKFTPVKFTTAVASRGSGTGKNYDAGNPKNGDTANIETASGKVLTKVKLGDDTVEIDFIG